MRPTAALSRDRRTTRRRRTRTKSDCGDSRPRSRTPATSCQPSAAPLARGARRSYADATTRRASQLFQIPEGSNFLIEGGHFLWFDHGGTLRLRLTLDEMLAIRPFGAERTDEQAWAELSRDADPTCREPSFDDSSAGSAQWTVAHGDA